MDKSKNSSTPTSMAVNHEKEHSRGLIEKLLAEVDSMDPTLAIPLGEVEQDDEIVGEIHDDYLRRLLVLAHYYHREEARMATEMKFEPAIEERQKMDLIRHRAEAKAKICMNMFWYGVREQLNIWCIGQVTVRDGYRIAKLKNNNLESALSRLFE